MSGKTKLNDDAPRKKVCLDTQPSSTETQPTTNSPVSSADQSVSTVNPLGAALYGDKSKAITAHTTVFTPPPSVEQDISSLISAGDICATSLSALVRVLLYYDLELSKRSPADDMDHKTNVADAVIATLALPYIQTSATIGMLLARYNGKLEFENFHHNRELYCGYFDAIHIVCKLKTPLPKGFVPIPDTGKMRHTIYNAKSNDPSVSSGRLHLLFCSPSDFQSDVPRMSGFAQVKTNFPVVAEYSAMLQKWYSKANLTTMASSKTKDICLGRIDINARSENFDKPQSLEKMVDEISSNLTTILSGPLGPKMIEAFGPTRITTDSRLLYVKTLLTEMLTTLSAYNGRFNTEFNIFRKRQSNKATPSTLSASCPNGHIFLIRPSNRSDYRIDEARTAALLDAIVDSEPCPSSESIIPEYPREICTDYIGVSALDFLAMVKDHGFEMVIVNPAHKPYNVMGAAYLSIKASTEDRDSVVVPSLSALPPSTKWSTYRKHISYPTATKGDHVTDTHHPCVLNIRPIISSCLIQLRPHQPALAEKRHQATGVGIAFDTVQNSVTSIYFTAEHRSIIVAANFMNSQSAPPIAAPELMVQFIHNLDNPTFFADASLTSSSSFGASPLAIGFG